MKQESGQDDDTAGKMFIGGLCWETTQGESLQRYFERYGEITDCVVMTNPDTGRSRGFGFVTFANPATVERVLQSGPHQLDGRTIDPKPCTPKGAPTGRNTKAIRNSSYKIFLGGLPAGITETELKNFFQQYGNVIETVIMFDQENKKSKGGFRGFGFVTFDDDEPVERCVQEHYATVMGKQVEMKRAEPRGRDEEGSDRRGGRGGGGGGGAPRRGGAKGQDSWDQGAPQGPMGGYQGYGPQGGMDGYGGPGPYGGGYPPQGGYGGYQGYGPGAYAQPPAYGYPSGPYGPPAQGYGGPGYGWPQGGAAPGVGPAAPGGGPGGVAPSGVAPPAGGADPYAGYQGGSYPAAGGYPAGPAQGYPPAGATPAVGATGYPPAAGAAPAQGYPGAQGYPAAGAPAAAGSYGGAPGGYGAPAAGYGVPPAGGYPAPAGYGGPDAGAGAPPSGGPGPQRGGAYSAPAQSQGYHPYRRN